MNKRVLDFQQLFVDKTLSYTLKYDHLLYCMDNETSVSSDWGKFWADYIRKEAFLQGKTVYTTEMWNPWNLEHVFHLESIDNPEIFNFVDISQNNHQSGDAHWNNALGLFDRLQKMGNVRPVNNLKVYGNDGGGSVGVDLASFSGTPELSWVNVLSSEWTEPIRLEKGEVMITTPTDHYWIALIRQR